ncbi:MAG: TSUP family transporter [Micavibrio sp.]
MAAPVVAFLIFSVFATSFLSGIFGMMGGMVLMVILLAVMPVSAAMSLHAAIQLVSNGWRCFLWRKHIVWHVLPPYFCGIAAGFILMILLHYVPDRNMALVMMGSLPLLSMLANRFIRLDVMNPYHTAGTATLLTFVHLTAGVVGPLLDLLYINAPLTRQQIVSTKAFTQSAMHIVRLAYFGVFLTLIMGNAGWAGNFDAVWLPVLLGASVAGTSAAALVLHRMNDNNFKAISRVLIGLISAYCLYEGITGLLAA